MNVYESLMFRLKMYFFHSSMGISSLIALSHRKVVILFFAPIWPQPKSFVHPWKADRNGSLAKEVRTSEMLCDSVGGQKMLSDSHLPNSRIELNTLFSNSQRWRQQWYSNDCLKVRLKGVQMFLKQNDYHAFITLQLRICHYAYSSFHAMSIVFSLS